jgi:putative membrane protein
VRLASVLPALLRPWEFSWTEFLALWLIAWWYLCGLVSSPSAERPSIARTATFFAGMAIIYIVVQTRFEYLALHMFFITRIQHIAMHHLGPMLIALAWPGRTLEHGMPAALQRIVRLRAIKRVIDALQQPLLSATLFVGLIAFWLVPAVHFRTMIDPNLYVLMNWTMVVDGVLFWCLVLDPHPRPPARLSFLLRAALSVGVMFPQILLGAIIVFASRDLYPSYDLCGRLYPSVGAGADQVWGGLIIWIPAAMMSVVGALIVVDMWRRSEEAPAALDGARAEPAALSSARWTGL